MKVYGTDFLTVACDPTREDVAIEIEKENGACPEPSCLSSGASTCACAPLDECDINEVCLPEGLCADEITARTSCRKKCGDDGDCRNGYECTRTGSRGVYRAPDLDNPGTRIEVDVCMPAV